MSRIVVPRRVVAISDRKLHAAKRPAVMRQMLEYWAVPFRDGRLAVRSLVALVLALLPLLPSSGLHSEEPRSVRPISRRGAYEGGQYRIEVPARWNGGLVMYAHGFGGDENSPLAWYLAEQGYAWAGSSYRSAGHRVDWYIDDTLKLRELFIREIGRPRWTIIHGRSMGGHVAIASLEVHPGVYQGALIECGVIDGVRIVDLIYAYRAAAEFFCAPCGGRAIAARPRTSGSKRWRTSSGGSSEA
jgi:Tannase-like family of unknown function (DUF6351)